MAIVSIGPNGVPNGKTGNLVFYMLKGQLVSRTIGKPGKPSKAQLANRQAMAVTMQLLRPMCNFINCSFEQEAQGTTKNPHNLAVSYNKKQALQGEYPNLSVNYSKVILSKGNLPAAKDLKLEKQAEGIHVRWNTQPDPGGKADDIVMILLYIPSKNAAVDILNAGRRSSGEYLIPLRKDFMDLPIEAYICFKKANGKAISDSVYLGNLNGPYITDEAKQVMAKQQALKQRFEQVSADYHRQMDLYDGAPPRTKAFKKLEREYESLREKSTSFPP